MIKSANSAFGESEKSIFSKESFSNFQSFFDKAINQAISDGQFHMFINVADMNDLKLTGTEFDYAILYIRNNGYMVENIFQDGKHLLRISWEF